METTMNKLKMVPCVDASDLPQEIRDWCIDNDISTHYACELHQVYDDNIFAEWLKSQGFKFKNKDDFEWIGVIGT